MDAAGAGAQMSRYAHSIIAITVMAAGLLAATAAPAQYYGPARSHQPPPLCPYERQPDRLSVAPPSGSRYHERRRDRRRGQRDVVHTRRIVRHAPRVIETTRVVDDPPRVIVRRHYVDGPTPARTQRDARETDANKKHVIEADAEVTIVGTDRMTIRLFPKGSRGREHKTKVE